MNFELDEDQAMIEATVERFVSDRYAPGARDGASRAREEENWSLLGNLGVLAALFEPDDGGLGGGAADVMVVLRALGRGLVCEPVLEQVLLAGRVLAAAGSAAQKDEWVPGILAAERRLGVAFAEQGARWSLTPVDARIEGATLSGTKSFATGGVEGWIVSALDEEGKAALALVRADAAGVTQRAYRRVDGSVGAEVRFENVSAQVLPGSLASVAEALDMARLGATAEMVGLIDRIFASTLEYVRTRRQFGAPIGSFQAIQHRLADVYGRIELARSQLLRAATAAPEDRPRAITAAKAHVSGVAVTTAEESIQLHGGMGASDELDIGMALKRILVLSTLLGDAGHEVRRYNALMRQAG